MSANNSLGIKTHLNMGIFYGTLAGLVQGFAEAFILPTRYNSYILGPQDIFRYQTFFFISKILHLDKNELAPFILDRYLGPNLTDKMLLVYNLIAVYAIAGLIIGVCISIFLWIVFKSARKSPDSKRLGVLYLSSLLSFGIFINVMIFVNGKIASFTILGLLINLSVIATALFFTGLIYQLGCTLIREKYLESNKTIPSAETSIRLSKIALLLVGLITCMGLILTLGVFREDKRASEIFTAQKKHNMDNVLTNTNGKNINVIFISIDSLRADHLGCYGYVRKTSSNIDRLATEGVMFSNASSVSSWTLPSHMSMLTSLYSESHGVNITSDYLDENRITLAEVLRKEGYTTAAFVSGPYLHSIYGLNQGFDLYDDFTINYDIPRVADRAFNSHKNPNIFSDPIPESAHTTSHRILTSPRLNESIQSWLQKNYQKKFFLFLHYWDVHFDYNPPPPYDTMFDPNYKGTINSQGFINNPRIEPGMNARDLDHIIALYDGEIAFTDKYIGELLSLLKKLNVYDRTLIVLTSDHGDEFFEHGWKGHGFTLYEEVLHVPLIFKFPSDSDFVANKEVKELVSIIDIMPTILDYMGIQHHQEMQGRTLLPLANGNRGSSKLNIYSSLYKMRTLVAARSANSKLIYNLETHEKELYDLVDDPGEKINLSDKGTSESVLGEDRYLISLVNWLNAQHQFSQALPKEVVKNKVELSEPMKEHLKSLGYIQ